MQSYFCDKCSADPTVSKSVGINPNVEVNSCLHCGAPINLAVEALSLEQRVKRLEDAIFNDGRVWQLANSDPTSGVALPQQQRINKKEVSMKPPAADTAERER